LKHAITKIKIATDICHLGKLTTPHEQQEQHMHTDPILIEKFVKTNQTSIRIHLIIEHHQEFLISIREFYENLPIQYGIVLKFKELKQLTNMFKINHD
jgi:hypothetical protein